MNVLGSVQVNSIDICDYVDYHKRKNVLLVPLKKQKRKEFLSSNETLTVEVIEAN